MITLRPVELCDVELMEAIENDASQWTLAGAYAPVSREMLMQYALGYDADPLRAGQLRMVICRGEEAVGLIDLYEIDVIHQRAFVGVYIMPSCRRAGMASGALAMLEQYSSEVLGLRQLAARVESGNDRSMRLFSKAGYACGPLLRDWYRRGRTFVDVAIFQKILC